MRAVRPGESRGERHARQSRWRSEGEDEACDSVWTERFSWSDNDTNGLLIYHTSEYGAETATPRGNIAETATPGGGVTGTSTENKTLAPRA